MISKYNITNGADTLRNLLVLGIAKTAVVISKVTVNYRVRNTSSYNINIFQ